MRLFQNFNWYASYIPRFWKLAASEKSFAGHIRLFVADRDGASHILSPIQEADPAAFLTVGHNRDLQAIWARENGLNPKAPLDDILLAQIEAHRTEVFYNMDPVRFGHDFVKRLPGSVKRAITWRAAPSPGANFSGYHKVVSNFPGILKQYAEMGYPTAYFFPAHDPEMDAYAASGERPVDVLFVGGYSRHHRRRAELLESVAAEAKDLNIALHLDATRLVRLAETPLGYAGLLKHRRPEAIRRIARPAIFGRDYYKALSQAKIVLNGAIDMAGSERGNMRCFEAMGCGALLLSDEGLYPEGMIEDETLVTYSDVRDATAKLRELIVDAPRRLRIARRGHAMISDRYSKPRQWARFQDIVA